MKTVNSSSLSGLAGVGEMQPTDGKGKNERSDEAMT